jgi:hypothetical protein
MRGHLLHVIEQAGARETVGEDTPGGGVDLDTGDSLDAARLQPQLEPADAGEHGHGC